MSLNPKALPARILAGAFAVSLPLSVVACTEAEDAASQAGDVIESATAEAGSAINDIAADDGGESTADPADPAEPTDSTEGTDGNTTEVETSDGSTMELPSVVAEAAWAAGFSTLEGVEEGGNGEMLATFVEGHIANSEETGAHPLVGEIAETWISEGGLDADIGLPTAPEEPSGDGWTQSFTNGVINWVNDGSGNYSADIQQE